MGINKLKIGKKVPEFDLQSTGEKTVKLSQLKGKNIIILDELLSIEEKSVVILKTLKKFNLETVYLPSWIREHIESDNNMRS